MKRTVSVVFAVAFLFSGTINAALHNRGGGMIYQDGPGITFLSDANYAATQFAQTGGVHGDADGRMIWIVAMEWADSLVYGGYDDWQLMPGPTLTFLFESELGGERGQSILTTHNENFELFESIQPDFYWGSKTATGIDRAWGFSFGIGDHASLSKSEEHYAWPARLGDVTVVPLPAGIWLMLSAIVGVLRFRKT